METRSFTTRTMANGELPSLSAPTDDRRRVRFIALVIILAAFVCIPTRVPAKQKQQRRRKVFVSIRNHIPPIDILDGSFQIELDKKFQDINPVGGRYVHKYQGFKIGRVKLFDGEGERIFPEGKDPDVKCPSCKIQIWLQNPQTTSAQIVISSSQNDFELDSDQALVWETDQSQDCPANKECHKCLPGQHERTERYSHPGYGGSFQIERVQITDQHGVTYPFQPAPGHHGGFRIMIWKQ